MANLDRLIVELCPRGVENKKLEEVIISLKTGLNPRKNFQLNTDDAENYYVTVREIVNGKIMFFEKTDRVNDIALKLINNRSNLEVGDVLFSGVGTVGRIAVIEEQPTNWNINEGIYVIKPKKEHITPKFLAYILGSSSIMDAYRVKVVGSPIKGLRMSDLRKLKIPIPPLPVQREIVRILDNFTELTAELTAELTVRKKQYGYYRNKLLTFDYGASHLTDRQTDRQRNNMDDAG
jgi:type I restriction enzyme S subunit